MVIYDLICPQGHRFEGWFPGHEAFESQQEEGLIQCHICGDRRVEKLLSGGHFVRDRARKSSKKPASPKCEASSGAIVATGDIDAIAVIKTLRHYIVKNFENVGDGFADKAIKMHHGEMPQQNIYGQATPEEQEMLAEEEIPHVIIPDLPPEFDN